MIFHLNNHFISINGKYAFHCSDKTIRYLIWRTPLGHFKLIFSNWTWIIGQRIVITARLVAYTKYQHFFLCKLVNEILIDDDGRRANRHMVKESLHHNACELGIERHTRRFKSIFAIPKFLTIGMYSSTILLCSEYAIKHSRA